MPPGHDAAGSRVTIVVEDAQRLGADALAELEALSANEFGDELGANIILMGQPGLKEWLDTPALVRVHQRTRALQNIEPLAKPEVLGYLRNTIRVAGGEFDKLFAEDAAGALHRCSQGIPRVINNICESGLTLAAENGATPMTGEFILKHASETLGIDVPAEVDEDSASAVAAAPEPAVDPEPTQTELPVLQPIAAAPDPVIAESATETEAANVAEQKDEVAEADSAQATDSAAETAAANVAEQEDEVAEADSAQAAESAAETAAANVAEQEDEFAEADSAQATESAAETAAANVTEQEDDISEIGEADSAQVAESAAEVAAAGSEPVSAETPAIEPQAANSETAEIEPVETIAPDSPPAQAAVDEMPLADATMTVKRPDWMLLPADNGGAAADEADIDALANAEAAADNGDDNDDDEVVPAVLTADVEATARLEVIDPIAAAPVTDLAPEPKPAPVAEPELTLEPYAAPEPQPELVLEQEAESQPEPAAELELAPEAPFVATEVLATAPEAPPQADINHLTGPETDQSPVEVAAEQTATGSDPTLDGIPELTLDDSLDQVRNDVAAPALAEQLSEQPPGTGIDPRVAEELSKATSLDDLDDEMAATLFGDEDFDAIAAAAIANGPAFAPANDDDGAVASGDVGPASAEAAASAVTPAAAAEATPAAQPPVATAQATPVAQPAPVAALEATPATQPAPVVATKAAEPAAASVAAAAKPALNKTNGVTPPTPAMGDKMMGYTGEFQMSMTSRFKMLDKLTKGEEKPVYSAINREPGANEADATATPSAGAAQPKSVEQQLQEKATATSPAAASVKGKEKGDGKKKPKTGKLSGLLSRFKR